jgi:hypothetical protein
VADDWSVLLPHRSRRIREPYKQAAEEAEGITVVSDVLHGLFPERTVRTVRNGLDSALLDRAISAPPRAQRLLYVGTLSERFDSILAGAILDELPAWRLDLYGACAYSRRGDQPGADLVELLQR